MTSAPAQRLGLRDRGILREGTWADMVIFDPTRIMDRATFQDPVQYPSGIDYVLVNGTPTVIEGQLQPERAGQILRCTHTHKEYAQSDSRFNRRTIRNGAREIAEVRHLRG